MTELVLGALSALWLGILTSISPCPLATNIAAMSFIGRRVGSPRHVFASGILYMLGRAFTYLFLGALLVKSLLSASNISFALQTNMNKVLGPVLILVGLFLLGVFNFSLPGIGLSDSFKRRIEGMGVAGAALLGIIFALSFCPVSAALFFGSLIPLAVSSGSAALLPSVYGIGTALPVAVFAILIASGVHSVGKLFNRITSFELWARRITGVLFIAIGIYFCLIYILHLSL
ncbi:MAG: sulfite exporter TauE/SafE family protein [Candidatus Abyssobacteria bacterium SURF_17]|uniref:Sulfite exporter TauE/SafE family protein n=1 Tax=Candidatus Abyssobacteria bacterium SURF_17 TaxID=2093361 RepID=A0A419F9U3_9BACT|nr:MAG: sulfite exporter TauE/SafE family protein [Candidatus Abyssubacteria bacterium SURF_17]